MNVFDKSLLFEMSYALMRRFAFIEIASPGVGQFHELIDEAADGGSTAASVAKKLLSVREVKDIGPAIYIDLARYARQRRRQLAPDNETLAYECF